MQKLPALLDVRHGIGIASPSSYSFWFFWMIVALQCCVCFCSTAKGISYMYTCAQLLQLCPPLCDPMDCSPSGSSVHGILQASILEWVALPSSRGSSQPRDRTCISCGCYTVSGFFILEPLGKSGSFCTWHLSHLSLTGFFNGVIWLLLLLLVVVFGGIIRLLRSILFLPCYSWSLAHSKIW